MQALLTPNFLLHPLDIKISLIKWSMYVLKYSWSHYFTIDSEIWRDLNSKVFICSLGIKTTFLRYLCRSLKANIWSMDSDLNPMFYIYFRV
jgi:hypothetical protein